jgi:hypothetical protein
MNIFAMTKKGLLILFILGGTQLVAMNANIKAAIITLNFHRSMASWRLIEGYEKWIQHNVIECKKKLQFNCVDPKVIYNNLNVYNNLIFWNRELKALKFMVSTLGLIDVGLKIEEARCPLQHETLYLMGMGSGRF